MAIFQPAMLVDSGGSNSQISPFGKVNKKHTELTIFRKKMGRVDPFFQVTDVLSQKGYVGLETFYQKLGWRNFTWVFPKIGVPPNHPF